VRAALVAGLALAALAVGAGAASATKWLCRPGQANDPCTPGLATTRISQTGQVLGVTRVKRAARPKIDCFYVYPTVSGQPTPEANLRIDPEERSIALYQAARYSQVCRVFAPMYRQITLAGLGAPATVTAAMRNRAYADVRDAWRTYLRRYNHGRGVVLIGHSQGTFVLRPLIAKEIDRRASVRRRLVSAILLGGNVVVGRGGDFRHIRPCRSPRSLRCVVAFSTFDATPPPDAVFGRTTVPGQRVLCTNPAALGGGSARLHSVFPTKPFAPGTAIGIETGLVGFPMPHVSTPWVQASVYTGRCSSAGGANVLLITGNPPLRALPNAAWGLHLTDANIALGDLVALVRRQAARFAAP
jgi:Protein of unknown function (DUF3089)